MVTVNLFCQREGTGTHARPSDAARFESDGLDPLLVKHYSPWLCGLAIYVSAACQTRLFLTGETGLCK